MKFIDPRIDFAFKKIFGSEDAKDILISFLEGLLGLDGDRRIVELTILDPFLAPRIKELKSSVLDVRCKDHRGVSYVVEMQMEKVAGFLSRIQYNSAKAFSGQIGKAEDYPKLKQVIAVTITDFILFPKFDHCVSCHQSQETITGDSYLSDIVHYFIELTKFTKILADCDGILEKWIYFIRFAETLDQVPEQLDFPPFRQAFEKAMVANMTQDELDLYDKAGIAIADARGRIELARKEGIQIGEQRGEQIGEAKMLIRLLRRRFGILPVWAIEKITKAQQPALEEWSLRFVDAKSLDEVFTK
ncbi:MAG TPA: Rpn family recombination-promoting nuclease/putative transposase [Magnetococcales bacterium]|nr:Rpn family recombination-promoting nuclease/putative transposase [Magnetococcales bacterium]